MLKFIQRDFRFVGIFRSTQLRTSYLSQGPPEIFFHSKKTAVHADHFVLFDRYFLEDHGDASHVLEASSQ